MSKRKEIADLTDKELWEAYENSLKEYSIFKGCTEGSEKRAYDLEVYPYKEELRERGLIDDK